MTTLFDPIIELEVFTESGTRIKFPEDNERPTHIGFEVQLTSKRKPNEATIRVYNLNEDTRNLIEDEGAGVRLYAGYVDAVGKIFEGTITTATSSPDGNVDNVTTIVSGDGYKNLDRSYFAKSYRAGTQIYSILQEVCGILGLPFSIASEASDLGTLLRGRSFDAKAKKVLTQLCNENGLSWRIDYGVLYIDLMDTEDHTNPEAIILSEETGLIEIPTVTFETYLGVVRRRITAKSLLQVGLRPGRLVEIKSPEQQVTLDKKYKKYASELIATGVYLLDEVRFIGDVFGGPFDTEISGYANR